MNFDNLRLGTSSWSTRDWIGPFYPEGTRSEAFIEYYATQFNTVEIDATFYRMPTQKNVDSWARRTPDGFQFTAKTPQLITHEKVLVDALDDMRFFLDAIGRLGDKLGAVLLQFPYFNKQAFASPTPFLERLDTFLGRLPKEIRYVVEVRNKWWVKKALQTLLQQHQVALAWVEQAWMPNAPEWFPKTGGPSTDFAYIRFLGDHKAMDEITTTFDKTVVDRTDVLNEWVPVVKSLLDRDIQVYGFFNNHFAGHAPDSIRQFSKMLNETLE
ncbi:MAG: DUF72 domain-containing protein [Deltaproteobacteria bacterium]|nr:DUF72 domain-containing protein [Deltaproteobacteria bacterium]